MCYCPLDAVDSKEDKTDEPDFHEEIQRTSGKECFYINLLHMFLYVKLLVFHTAMKYPLLALLLNCFTELQTAIQQISPTKIDLPITEAVLESSIVSPQTSSLLLSSNVSSSRKSDNEG